MTSAPPPQMELEVMSHTHDDFWEGKAGQKKKRPGLSQGLIPGKKVIKMYKEQKLNDIRN